jgi:hypothetical protein
LLIPKETCSIAFSLSGVRCPGRDEPYSDEAIALMRRKIMQRDVEVISSSSVKLRFVHVVTSFFLKNVFFNVDRLRWKLLIGWEISWAPCGSLRPMWQLHCLKLVLQNFKPPLAVTEFLIFTFWRKLNNLPRRKS